jgi:hypothetical protein
MDAYNFSFILMNLWRTKSVVQSGVPNKLNEVPVYVEVNGELIKIIDVKEIDDKIILIKEEK